MIIDIGASPDHWKIVVILRRVPVAVEIELGLDHRFLRSGFCDGVKDVYAKTSSGSHTLRKRPATVGALPMCVAFFLEAQPDAFGLFEFGYVTSDMVRSSRKWRALTSRA